MLLGGREITDQHRMQDLHRNDDGGNPKRPKDAQVAHLGDRGDQDDEQARYVRHDAQGAGYDQFAHGDRCSFLLGGLGIPDGGKQDFIIFEETLGHLHRMRHGACSDDGWDHENQRVEGDSHPSGKAKAPNRCCQGSHGGNQNSMPAAEIGPKKHEDHDHGEHEEERDLEGVEQDPAYEDRVARDVDFDVLGFFIEFDLLHVIENRDECFSTIQPVGDETRSNQGALFIQGNKAAVDEGRVLPDPLSDDIGFLLGLGNLRHQNSRFDIARSFDLDDACIVRRDRADLIVVHGVGGERGVQHLLDLRGRRFQFLQFIPQLIPLVRAAVVATAIESLGAAVDAREVVRGKDRSFLHHDRDRDGRRPSEFVGEFILSADEGMIRPLVARLGIDIDGGQILPALVDGQENRVQDREEEEGGGNNQRHENREPPTDHGLGKNQGGGFFGAVFAHRSFLAGSPISKAA